MSKQSEKRYFRDVAAANKELAATRAQLEEARKQIERLKKGCEASLEAHRVEESRLFDLASRANAQTIEVEQERNQAIRERDEAREELLIANELQKLMAFVGDIRNNTLRELRQEARHNLIAEGKVKP